MVRSGPDRTSPHPFLRLSCFHPTPQVPYPPAHVSDTTNTSLASQVPDGSNRVVKSLVNNFVISLKIKTGSQRGHKRLFLTLCRHADSECPLLYILDPMTTVA